MGVTIQFLLVQDLIEMTGVVLTYNKVDARDKSLIISVNLICAVEIENNANGAMGGVEVNIKLEDRC